MGGELADARLWAGELKALHERFLHRFSRSEPRESALAYMRGLIAPLERKNGWTLAEEAGHGGPDRIHRLLNRIDWDADEVLDDVRDYVVEHLGDPEAVLIVDDTGFLKKGVRSAGVQRQYSGTAGRTENAQIGVFLAYAGGRGRTLIDRRLYLPTSWTDDRERCRAAGIEDTVAFETKVVMA
nr:IS701 family transposase [Streptomyces sp. DSM 41633]